VNVNGPRCRPNLPRLNRVRVRTNPLFAVTGHVIATTKSAIAPMSSA